MIIAHLNTGVLVQHQSHVDNRFKRSLLTTMLDRAYRLSSSWLYSTEECDRLKSLFPSLDYPHYLINSATSAFINSRVADQQPLQALGRLAGNAETRAVIPFKPGFHIVVSVVSVVSVIRKKFIGQIEFISNKKLYLSFLLY